MNKIVLVLLAVALLFLPGCITYSMWRGVTDPPRSGPDRILGASTNERGVLRLQLGSENGERWLDCSRFAVSSKAQPPVEAFERYPYSEPVPLLPDRPLRRVRDRWYVVLDEGRALAHGVRLEDGFVRRWVCGEERLPIDVAWGRPPQPGLAVLAVLGTPFTLLADLVTWPFQLYLVSRVMVIPRS